jgi:hypothetical protein
MIMQKCHLASQWSEYKKLIFSKLDIKASYYLLHQWRVKMFTDLQNLQMLLDLVLVPEIVEFNY